MSFVPVSTAVLNQWVRILGALEKKINRQSFETWLKPTRFSHIADKTMYVRIPSADFQHVGDRYGDLIQEAIDNLGLEIEAVVVQPPTPDPARAVREDGGFAPQSSHSASAPRSPRQSSPAGVGPEQSRFDWTTASQLNTRYHFDTFVTGSGNQFAHAAASAVGERPSKAYNPLFIYGGVGMGKTHLLHAIGHLVKHRTPHSAVSYISAEKFTNEMINSVRYEKMTTFRDKYRFLDVLLFIAGNVRTNGRELEGALVRLIAWCSMHGIEITLPTAQQCLKQFIDTQVRKITIEAIQRAVAEQFGMRVSELKQKNNSRQIVVPRQIAMYLAKQMTEASLPEIGRQFGGKHHTTVMHSISKIDEHRRTDKDLNRTVNKLMEILG